MIELLEKQEVMAMLFDKAMNVGRLTEFIFRFQDRRDSFQKSRLAVSDMPLVNIWIYL